MLTPEEHYADIHQTLLDCWPTSKSLELSANEGIKAANRDGLHAPLEAVQEAIDLHHTDETLMDNGRRRGEFPPRMYDYRAQLLVVMQRLAIEHKHERNVQAIDEQQANRRATLKGGLIPNLSAGVREWMALVAKRAPQSRRALTAQEEVRYQELARYFYSEKNGGPVEAHRNVVHYWQERGITL